MDPIYQPNIREAYQLFHEGILALQRAEQQGLRIDLTYIHKQNRRITRQIKQIEKDFLKTNFYYAWKKSTTKEINIYSPQQLGHYLYKVRKFKIKKSTAGGSGSTDEEALALLRIPELDMLLEVKKLKKLRDTYLAGLERETVDGFIHPFFNLHLARTYRGSSDSPNFQNIPKRDVKAMNMIRSAIYPRKGHQLLELDYSQLEVRIAACYHQDPRMLDFIRTGHDFHLDYAKEIFMLDEYVKDHHKTLRGATKNGFVFPQFYGDYWGNCAEALVSPSWCDLPKDVWEPGQGILIGDKHISDHLIQNGISEYGEIIYNKTTNKVTDITGFLGHIKGIETKFWKDFKVYGKWKENLWKEYKKNGYITNKTGFVFQGIMGRNDITNYPVQSSAFHVMLWALIKGTSGLSREKFGTKIVGQIHDAIVLDVHPKELERVVPIMKCIMESDVKRAMPWINVPLKVDAELCPVDGSWATKEDYKID